MSIPQLIVAARRTAGLSQAELARRAGTSQPTISAYEHGRTVPSADTLERILAATGHRLSAEANADTPELVRSRRLYVAIVGELATEPGPVIERARRSLATMRAADTEGHTSDALDRWGELLDGPVREIVRVLLDPDPHEAHLASSNPFAAALAPKARWEVIRRDRRLRRAS